MSLSSGELTVRGAAETIKLIGSVVVAMSGTLAVFTTAAWFVIQPRIQPFLDGLVTLNALNARVAKLEERVPPLPFIDYRAAAVMFPDMVRPGDVVTLTYALRTLIPCRFEMITRFYSVEKQGFDARLTETVPGVRGAASGEYSPVSMIVHIPVNITPGVWGYAPVISPLGECSARDVIYPPIVFFTVLAPDDAGPLPAP